MWLDITSKHCLIWSQWAKTKKVANPFPASWSICAKRHVWQLLGMLCKCVHSGLSYVSTSLQQTLLLTNNIYGSTYMPTVTLSPLFISACQYQFFFMCLLINESNSFDHLTNNFCIKWFVKKKKKLNGNSWKTTIMEWQRRSRQTQRQGGRH